MPSPESLRRLATLTSKVRKDLRRGGMAINFKYLFRSTAILARIVEVLADHVATQAENEKQAAQAGVASEGRASEDGGSGETARDGHPEAAPRKAEPRPRRQAAES